MLNKLRVRAQSEEGFTLVELLVVMLIIGLLAAIAIPAFFNQRDKANDASAKESARTAQTAIETYSTDNSGSYVGADGAALRAIEGVLPADCGGTPAGPCLKVTGFDGTGVPAATAYRVTVYAKTTDHPFSIARNGGTITYPCSGGGGCPSSNFWN